MKLQLLYWRRFAFKYIIRKALASVSILSVCLYFIAQCSVYTKNGFTLIITKPEKIRLHTITQPNTTQHNTTILQLPEETKTLIKASIAENTLKAYQRALQSLTTWLSGQLLAAYITALHETGKSPATIGQIIAAVKWQLKHQSLETINFPITQTTLAGIRRTGKNRGRGQVDGLIWQNVERVCILSEMENSLARLRDAAMIRLMSDCLLRISEVVAVNIGDLKDKTLTIHASKTNQEGTGESLYVCDATRNVLNQYRERAGITHGALFRHIRRGDHI